MSAAVVKNFSQLIRTNWEFFFILIITTPIFVFQALLIGHLPKREKVENRLSFLGNNESLFLGYMYLINLIWIRHKSRYVTITKSAIILWFVIIIEWSFQNNTLSLVNICSHLLSLYSTQWCKKRKKFRFKKLIVAQNSYNK